MTIIRLKQTFMSFQIKRLGIFLLLFGLNCLAVYSQNNETGARSSSARYREGVALFEAKNWGSALHLFEELEASEQGLLSDAAAYYIAASRLELGNTNGEAELKKFIEEQPESPLVNPALFRLANLSFNRKNYKETLQLYQKLDSYALTEEERDKFNYYSGVCMVETGDNARAQD